MSAQSLNGPVRNPPRPATPPRRDGTAERAGAEAVARLQRGILRLALAYHGQSPDLDKKLKQLGMLVRSGRRESGLQQLIDEIVNTIVALDLEKQPRGGAASPVAPDLLLHFFSHLAAPAPLAAEIERVRKRLAQRTEAHVLLGELEQTATALSARLAESAEGDRSVEQFRSGLIELLDRLPVSRGVAADAAQLRRTIESVQHGADIRPCAQALADLVCKLRDELQGELHRLTEFLRATARRLVEFEQALVRSGEMYAVSTADALQLSDTVCASVSGLRVEVNEATDLDTLKAAVEERLQAIDSNLERFVAAQTSRATEAGEVIERMTGRLKDLEQQAAVLREDLEVQHARVLIDPLTGVLNRAGYNETVVKLFARWKRYGGALSLAVIDLDLFKDINDRYGHVAGDKVLATVGAKLKEMIRQADVLCRYGGEEFVLLLPETSVTDGIVLLEKLRLHIEQCAFRHKDTPVRVTMSGGIAEFRPSDNVETVFERADQAMYNAKHSGRNRVCSEMDVPPQAVLALD